MDTHWLDVRHDKIRLSWFTEGFVEFETCMYLMTIRQAITLAKTLGYRSPRWYFPWEFYTRHLGIGTADFYGDPEFRKRHLGLHAGD